MRSVRIYIEGGATGKAADGEFRRGWKKFLTELHSAARLNGFRSLEIVRGKGRGNAYERFSKYHLQHPHDLCLLLVDSEGPVPASASVWDIVANRDGDRWQKPNWAEEHHLYLIVQFVETWLVADPAALQEVFGRGFIDSKLPGTHLEDRSKSEIENSLKVASRGSKKGEYRHGHSHEVIAHVAPEKVKQLHHGKRLFDGVASLIKESAQRN